MKKIVFIMTFLLFSVKGFSTFQVQDYLIFNKDTFFIYRPIGSQLEQPINGIKFDYQSSVVSTGCWRGYYAEWKIIDSTLYLSKVFDCYTHEMINSTVEKALGHNFINGLLKADWVNGDFSCGKGYMRHNYFRYNLILVIENGIIVKKDDFKQGLITVPALRQIEMPVTQPPVLR